MITTLLNGDRSVLQGVVLIRLQVRDDAVLVREGLVDLGPLLSRRLLRDHHFLTRLLVQAVQILSSRRLATGDARMLLKLVQRNVDLVLVGLVDDGVSLGRLLRAVLVEALVGHLKIRRVLLVMQHQGQVGMVLLPLTV